MSVCTHCLQNSNVEIFDVFEDQKIGPFCCEGCLTVYKVIKDKGLGEYYEIKKNIKQYKKRSPVELENHNYKFMDNEDFLKEYSYQNSFNQKTMEFYLEGVHCLACLWIIEKLPFFVDGVQTSKLDLGKSIATVSIQEEGSFSKVALELDSIGYKPHPLKNSQDSVAFKIKEERATLLRIGIAGAATGNIMIYAFSLYAGASAEYESFFNLLTVLFAIPVLTYCAFPFYKTSYYSLRNKSLSIDVPISMALIMGAVMGVYNLIVGIHENYFDSLTALVFLLLLSRYFLKSIQAKGLNTTDLDFFYQGSSVKKISDNNEIEEIHPKFIKVQDRIRIYPNEIIPADGIIQKGETYINNSLLTGESTLIKSILGDTVFSGTMNVSNQIDILVTKAQKETRLGKILKDLESSWGHKSSIIDIANKISKYFTVVVILLAALLYLIQSQMLPQKEALEKALTLLIVTCPCALAIAIPLTFIRTLSKSVAKGIVIKDDKTIEEIKQAKTIFLDKTGTITYNNMNISSFSIEQDQSEKEIYNIIYSLENYSKHPVGICLKEYVKSKNPQLQDVSDFIEVPGIGVAGKINQHFWQIKDYHIFKDHQAIAHFQIDDEIRPESFEAIATLKELGLKVCLLSGDKKEKVLKLAQTLNIDAENCYAEITPELKANVVKTHPLSIMVGDGANDALALSMANVGIAVHGAMDISLRASDVYLTVPGILSIVDLVKISHETMKVIYRNFILSLLYNSVSVLLAYTGHISPLTAAIIMPLSSLTVLISTLIGTKRLRELWK